MPTFALSPQERRLASFCRFFAVVYLLVALLVAAVPRFVYVIASLGQPSDLSPETRFWSLLAAALEVASAVACAVVAGDPRGRRHALLPVVAAKLTTTLLACVYLLSVRGPGARSLVAIVITDLPIFLLTLFVYRSSAPGVHSVRPTQAPPPPEGAATPVQLGVGPKP